MPSSVLSWFFGKPKEIGTYLFKPHRHTKGFMRVEVYSVDYQSEGWYFGPIPAELSDEEFFSED